MRKTSIIAAPLLALVLVAHAQEADPAAEAAEEAKLLAEAKAHADAGRKNDALKGYWKAQAEVKSFVIAQEKVRRAIEKLQKK